MTWLKLAALFLVFYAVAWLYAAIISDVIAKPRRRAREEARAAPGWYFFDGSKWYRDE